MKKRIAVLILLLCALFALGQAFTQRDIAFLGVPIINTDWAQRVVNNGGAMPSQSTIIAMETLRLSLIELGLTNDIYTMCIFVPDSVIAATTPLFKHLGSDPWTNFNFAASNLNEHGLAGDGTSKSLDTGMRVDAFNRFSKGVSVIMSDGLALTNGGVTVGRQRSPENPVFMLLSNGGNGSEFYTVSTVDPRYYLRTNQTSRTGFLSGNLYTNASATNISIYVANPLESFKTLNTRTDGLTTAWGADAATITVFANKFDNTIQSWQSNRMSMAALHGGWTPTQASNFWFCVNRCRQSLGGGTGDPVQDYNTRVVNAGGANISATTSNALRTFYQGLDTDDLLYRIVFANTYCPDSLTAARTPFIWNYGHSTWTNAFFDTTNLSVNGLQGDGTSKFLGTGVNVTAVHVGNHNDTSAGLSFLVYSNRNIEAVASAPIGAGSPSSSQQFSVTMPSTNTAPQNINFYCWKFINVNQDFLSVLRTNYVGFISGNRTAANAIRLDLQTNGVFNTFTNGSGAAQTGNNNTMTNMFAHAIYNPVGAGAPANWSADTISFVAMTGGLTLAQSSNLYTRVITLRNALGGGVP